MVFMHKEEWEDYNKHPLLVEFDQKKIYEKNPALQLIIGVLLLGFDLYLLITNKTNEGVSCLLIGLLPLLFYYNTILSVHLVYAVKNRKNQSDESASDQTVINAADLLEIFHRLGAVRCIMEVHGEFRCIEKYFRRDDKSDTGMITLYSIRDKIRYAPNEGKAEWIDERRFDIQIKEMAKDSPVILHRVSIMGRRMKPESLLSLHS